MDEPHSAGPPSVTERGQGQCANAKLVCIVTLGSAAGLVHDGYATATVIFHQSVDPPPSRLIAVYAPNASMMSAVSVDVVPTL